MSGLPESSRSGIAIQSPPRRGRAASAAHLLASKRLRSSPSLKSLMRFSRFCDSARGSVPLFREFRIQSALMVRPESQISIKPETPPNKQEIERRREIVRHFFNDFWMSTDDKPRTFAERLNRAEDHINERLAARGETWQLDA